jgi:ADP-ribose pyrophosphatase YjhB (NUDIX family)
VAPFPGKKKFLLHYIDLLEKTDDHPGVVLVASDVEDAVEVLESLFERMDAAGGLVERKTDGKYLFIYRMDRWDLPKGKVEAGESFSAAALREVEEETGLKDVELGDQLAITRHTYKIKSQRILKYTYWYKMRSEGENARPQEDEGIEEVRWMSLDEFMDSDSYLTYETINNMLRSDGDRPSPK